MKQVKKSSQPRKTAPARSSPAKAKVRVSESMEHYLTAVLSLSESCGVARVRDIGQKMGVKTPSVTKALASLVKGGYVRHETYGYVELTAAGAKVAKHVLRRREVLLRFLTEILGLDPRVADADACGMEHCLSEQTLERLVSFLEFMDFAGKDKGRQCLSHLRAFFDGGRDPHNVCHCQK